MTDFTLWDIVRNMLLAARWTVLLSLVAFIGGGIFGIGLLVLRMSQGNFIQRVIAGYVQVFQGTPLLMQLFLSYFGLALIGIDTSPWGSAAIALTLYSSAYLCEIWRGCVNSVPKGQWEASASLALSFKEQIQYVIFPQAARIALGPTVGFLVQVVKGTALASVIGFIELTKSGNMIANATFKPVMVYCCLAVMYFLICFPISYYARTLERKMYVGNH